MSFMTVVWVYFFNAYTYILSVCEKYSKDKNVCFTLNLIDSINIKRDLTWLIRTNKEHNAISYLYYDAFLVLKI